MILSSLRRAVFLALTLILLASAHAQTCNPVKIILDTDFGSSTDDVFALMMANRYMDEGRVDLLGVVVDREGEANVAAADIVNTYYGHPDIMLGLERDGVKSPRYYIPYAGIGDLKNADGQPLFPQTVDPARCMEGYKLYRKILAKAEDKSVVVVAIGFATTLARLFESEADEHSPLGGLDLFERKVKAVYMQSGRFTDTDSLSGYNMRAASRQAQKFYDLLPASVDLVMSPSNVGDIMDYAPADVLADLAGADTDPIKAIYTHYDCNTGQRMWDVNCLVQAVEGDRSYRLSPRGKAVFVDKGEDSLLLFKPDPYGNARYQLPPDTYEAMRVLMEIRRLTRTSRP